MSQVAYWNYLADDATADLNRWLLGILEPGRYRGFDFATTAAGLTLKLAHASTGLLQTRSNGAQVRTGVILSKQGSVIQEDTDVTLPISPTAAYPRVDLVVCSHQYQQVAGGQPAQYSVVQGTPGQSPITPSVINGAYDVVIGTLYMPANCSSLTAPGVLYTPKEPANVGGRYHLPLSSETAVMRSPAGVTDLDLLRVTGLFLCENFTHTPATITGDNDQYVVLVTTHPSGVFLTQLAMRTGGNSSVYYRSYSEDDYWSDWINLNPTQAIATALTPVIQSVTALELYTRRIVGDVKMTTKYDPADFDATGLGKANKPAVWGWAIANGQNGTQDMRSRFVVAYDNGKSDTPVNAPPANSVTYNYGAVNNTGGADSVQLSSDHNGPHSHTAQLKPAGNDPAASYGIFGAQQNGIGSGQNRTTVASTDNSGYGSPHENRPPYIVLLFLEWIGR